MTVLLLTPAPPRSRKGNRVTALRWARILRELGHTVRIEEDYRPELPADLLLALHAGRSADSIERFRRRHPDRPVVLALTGTDLYDWIRTRPEARRSLEIADRMIVLQAAGLDELPDRHREKTHVIHQSACPAPRAERRVPGFQVCQLAHLRPVKDPLRAALAAEQLPSSSRITILHCGAALSEGLGAEAERRMAATPRYRWLGPVPRAEALRILKGSDLLVLTSRLEGGANVVSEAIAASTPVVSSRIAGSIGILGDDYPGYFPVGDTGALARLLHRSETDPSFHADLRARCEERRPLVSPERERRAWRDLLEELVAGR